MRTRPGWRRVRCRCGTYTPGTSQFRRDPWLPSPRGEARAADGGTDGADLARRAAAEEGDGHDADDRDQGNEQGVLDEAGAPLVTTELGPQVRSTVLLPIGNDIHEQFSRYVMPQPGPGCCCLFFDTTRRRLDRTIGPLSGGTTTYGDETLNLNAPCQSRRTMPMRNAWRTAWVRSRVSSFW